jgi:hypothetical protein
MLLLSVGVVLLPPLLLSAPCQVVYCLRCSLDGWPDLCLHLAGWNELWLAAAAAVWTIRTRLTLL